MMFADRSVPSRFLRRGWKGTVASGLQTWCREPLFYRVVWSYSAPPGSQRASLVPSSWTATASGGSWLDQTLLPPLSWFILVASYHGSQPLSPFRSACPRSFLVGQSGAVTSLLASMGTFPRPPVRHT